jgi:hypothetical protein
MRNRGNNNGYHEVIVVTMDTTQTIGIPANVDCLKALLGNAIEGPIGSDMRISVWC